MTDQLPAAAAAVDRAADIVAVATEHLACTATVDRRISVAELDRHQVLGYDLAHTASAVEGANVMLAYAERGEVESLLNLCVPETRSGARWASLEFVSGYAAGEWAR
jgi:hypothetical protein